MAKHKRSELGKTPAKPQDVFADLRQTTQDRIKKQLFGDAASTKALLEELGDDIAKQCGCRVCHGEIKAEASALRKLNKDYKSAVLPEGDWYQMKDICRMTIIAPVSSRLDAVGKMIRARCVASVGMGILKDEEAFADKDECGYSGLNFVIKLTNGRPGEIQANIPSMMYGKMSKQEFSSVLSTLEYMEFLSRLRIEGGYGHGLYEVQRANLQGMGPRAAKVSKTYYSYLRNGHFRPQVVAELMRELDVLVQTLPCIFHGFAPKTRRRR